MATRIIDNSTAGTQRHRRFSLRQSEALTGYLFIAPQLVGYCFFVLGPTLAIFVLSFQSRNLLTSEFSWVGFDNYVFMLTEDPLFFKVLLNSLIFTFGATIINIPLAIILALLLYRNLFGMTFFRALFFSPVITSTAAWVIVWSFLLQGRRGTVNMMLFELFDIRGPNWLNEMPWAMVWAILTIVIKGVGLNMIILLSALKDIPQEYSEAARVDGATSSQIFFKITLPLLAPAIMLATILTFIGGLGVFDHIQLLTGGGPSNGTNVLSFYVYFQAFRVYEIGYASALAVVLFLAALGLTVTVWSLRHRFVYGEE